MSSIYFAHADGRIKVGVTSKSVKGRLAQISASLPKGLQLIAAIPGDRNVERQIHRHLFPFKLNGEWFLDSQNCRAIIHHLVSVSRASLVAVEPPPIVVPASKVPRFGDVCRLLWPEKTAAHLASIGNRDERTAKRWLSGEYEPPLVVVLAVIHRMFERP